MFVCFPPRHSQTIQPPLCRSVPCSSARSARQAFEREQPHIAANFGSDGQNVRRRCSASASSRRIHRSVGDRPLMAAR